ncbi:hypothetical protein SAMN02745146_3402 [Hymenobacter daecheongensis DSM 21074]|uniref:Uncharacterized protein n=1 Tax=Hymenobacter daecheongensis DSM 21074 TaxID=1121955 RepID=A0A1M6K5W7_9BACT|nr:hypothetical protein [Hymenobacter daecheongensis]SHJ54328.1 hypothetical protein SAMN02745146_3402 [Hymenobacter daecheongensis DSM 21074]
MDNTVIVALGTLTITSIVTLLTKWIESRQKVNEHKLSLRNIYVNKKIQAGEELANLLHQRKLVFVSYYQFYNFFKDTGYVHTDMAYRCKVKTLALSELLSKPNYFSIYFDYEKKGSEISRLEVVINKNIQILNKASDLSEAKSDDEKKVISQELNILKESYKSQEIENIIKVVPLLNSLYTAEVEKVKSELSKYDFI